MTGSSTRLDDVEFLTRSTNRLDVLTAIRDTPRTRRELRADTDFSRVTLSRILGDLADRGWIVRRDGQYEATPAGVVVCTEVNRLIANLGAVDSLGECLHWLPVERFDFELARLADAEVLLPDEHDLTAQIRWVDDRVQDTDRIRSIASWVAPEILESVVESTVDGGCRFEGVVERHVVEHLREDPELREPVRELVESDRAGLYRYDGDDVEITMSILSDGVLMCGRQDVGSLPEAVVTTDEEVLDWASARFESLRAESTPIDADSFTP